MAIECYYSTCKFHDVLSDPDNGPFCHEQKCRLDPKEDEFELNLHNSARELYLRSTNPTEKDEAAAKILDTFNAIVLEYSKEKHE